MEAVAAVLKEPSGPFSIETVEVAAPRAGEVLVDIKAVGICHTDLAAATGAFGNPFPVVLGHEGAGVVEAVGDGVTNVKPGDKVLLTFNSCGECKRCKSNDPAYCLQFFPMNFGCVHSDGTNRLSKDGATVYDNFFGQSSFAAKAVANSRNVLKVADDADLATLAPLGCGIQTGAGGVMRSLNAKQGESLVVIGGGAVGLSAVMGGKIAGCDPIILIEPQAARREEGLALGATHAIDPIAQANTAEAVRAIVPDGVDMVVDTSGYLPAVEQAVNMVCTLGRIGLIGVPGSLDAALPVPLVQFITMGGTVRGIIEGDSDITGFLPELIAHHAAGRLPVDQIITRYPFSEINPAIEDGHHGKCIKAVLTFD